MKDPVVIIGMGEMGGVFARGLLKLGHPIYPVLRGANMRQMAAVAPEPRLVLVTVGETDLHSTLDQIPNAWRDRVALLQNELLPASWERHGIRNPTVVAVWFEKKKGQEVKVLLPSPVYGPGAALLSTALGRLDIPTRMIWSEDELIYELVGKNVYIITTNIAGLMVGGTVADLWDRHRELALEVANEVIDVQLRVTGEALDRERLLGFLAAGIEGDPGHQCMGRSAPARLQRCLTNADHHGLAVPRLRAICAEKRSAQGG